MSEARTATEASPLHHVGKLKQMLSDVAAPARSHSEKVSDAKAQALFETSAEVMLTPAQSLRRL